MNDLQAISSKIMTLPNRPPFMLDKDLATIYGTTTKHINQAVKRNPARFPDDFVFQLTKKEAEGCGFDDSDENLDKLEVTDCDLKFNSWGGRRHLPYGFTREGCNMLSAVLNTPFAVSRSIQIMRAFSAMEERDTRFTAILCKVMEKFSALDKRVENLKNQPQTALSKSIAHKNTSPRKFVGGFRYPETREMILTLRRQGCGFKDIAEAIKRMWPDDPRRHVSKSAIHRFWQGARRGKFKEFGIDITVHK